MVGGKCWYFFYSGGAGAMPVVDFEEKLQL